MKNRKLALLLFSISVVCCTNKRIIRTSDWKINIDQSNLGALTRLRYEIDSESIRISKLLSDDSSGAIVYNRKLSFDESSILAKLIDDNQFYKLDSIYDATVLSGIATWEVDLASMGKKQRIIIWSYRIEIVDKLFEALNNYIKPKKYKLIRVYLN